MIAAALLHIASEMVGFTLSFEYLWSSRELNECALKYSFKLTAAWSPVMAKLLYNFIYRAV